MLVPRKTSRPVSCTEGCPGPRVLKKEGTKLIVPAGAAKWTGLHQVAGRLVNRYATVYTHLHFKAWIARRASVVTN